MWKETDTTHEGDVGTGRGPNSIKNRTEQTRDATINATRTPVAGQSPLGTHLSLTLMPQEVVSTWWWIQVDAIEAENALYAQAVASGAARARSARSSCGGGGSHLLHPERRSLHRTSRSPSQRSCRRMSTSAMAGRHQRWHQCQHARGLRVRTARFPARPVGRKVRPKAAEQEPACGASSAP